MKRSKSTRTTMGFSPVGRKSFSGELKYPDPDTRIVVNMKVRELIELVDETIANLKIAIIANQNRVFESPHTSYEFAQRVLELQEDLDDLLKAREYLGKFDPDDEVENHFSEEELREFLRMLELLRTTNAHAY